MIFKAPLKSESGKVNNFAFTFLYIILSYKPPFGKRQTVIMKQYLKQHESNLKDANGKIHSGEKTNKCNQCDYDSSQAGDLRKHLKMHSGEKSYKCNQCNYASSHAGDLRNHSKIHSGENSNKCNQCDFAFPEAQMCTNLQKL